ncbi:MAG: prolipoprotein diacylglyceryl transferase [Deferribacteraceae bacterium]|jgi:phosphatidylglycerol:prolipoprotein diacylglycerol transferase|nr:prolipoprotein diacylglyceryl transferase [Deferribacteraceae bacterium]
MFPYIFKIGNFEIRYYSLMYLIGILLTLFFTKKKAKKLGLNPEEIENLILFTFIGGILGARIYYVLFRWDFYKNTPFEMFAIWHGGLAIHGGIIGGFITFLLFSKLKKIRALLFGDLILPFLLLAQGIGRFGNFANGEAHGVPTITPPSIIFSLKNKFPEFWSTVLGTLNLKNNPSSISSLKEMVESGKKITILFENKIYELKYYVPWGISFPEKYFPPAYQEFGRLPVHPTFFYEMILNFIAAAFLIYLWKNDNNIGRGKITGLYLIFYGLIRGFVTTFRADDLMIGLLRAPHLASIIMVIIGIIILNLKREAK